MEIRTRTPVETKKPVPMIGGRAALERTFRTLTSTKRRPVLAITA